MKRAFIVICALLVIGAAGCSNKKAASDVSLKLDSQKAEWFKDAKFGMFIHWGLYSILEGSYNGRICFSDPEENIDFLEMHDNSYPKEMLDKPWQTPATMQNSWAYHSKDYNWKPAARMLRYLVSNTSMGGNYLLNVGPKADGTLPAPAVRRLREMGAWLGANGEAVYGTEPSSLKVNDGDVYLTEKTAGKEKSLYIFITSPRSSVTIPSDL